MSEEISLPVQHKKHKPPEKPKLQPPAKDPKQKQKQPLPPPDKSPQKPKQQSKQASLDKKKGADTLKLVPSKSTNQQPVNPKVAIPQAVPEPKQSVLTRIQYSKNSIAQNLKLLLSQYHDIGEKQQKLHGHNPQKQAAVKQFLQGLKVDRRERKKRLKQRQKSLKQIREEREKSQREAEEEFKENERRKKRDKMKADSEAMRKRNQQERANEKQRWRDFYKEFRKLKPLYVLKQEEFQKAVEDQQKQIEEKIRQVKIRHKSVQYEEILAHQQKHQKMLDQISKQKQDQRLIYAKQIEQQNQKLQQMWKGQCHYNVQLQRQQQQFKKRQPHVKLMRMHEYKDLVKEHYLPQTERKSQSQQFEVADSPQGINRRRRYRFMNGVSYGEVSEIIPSRMTDVEQRRLGNGYLRLLRSLPRKMPDDVKSSASSPKKEEFYESSGSIIKKSKTPADRYAQGTKFMRNIKVNKSMSEHLPQMASKVEIENIILRLKNQNNHIRRKEKQIRLDLNKPPVDHRQLEVDDKLVEVLEKKMKFLEELHKPPPVKKSDSDESDYDE